MQKLNITLFTISTILILFLVIVIESIAPIFILLFFGLPYLLFIFAKKIQENKDKEEIIQIENKISRLKTLKEEKETEITKLDDKIRFYTEDDYTATDISKLYYDSKNSGGVIVGAMRERAIRDIENLNDFIDKINNSEIHKKPPFKIKKENIIFDLPNEEQEIHANYTHFVKEELTKTGKEPKYPYFLFFRTVENTWIEKEGIISQRRFETIHGCLYYLSNQTIGKGWFIMWTKAGSYQIDIKLIQNELSISRISISMRENGVRKDIYNVSGKK